MCVDIAAGATPVAVSPPLAPHSGFTPPVTTPLAISSTFGPRWKASDQRDDFHLGIDYYGERGQPLFAIGDGVVTAVTSAGDPRFPNGGNVVVVEHVIPPTSFHDQTIDRAYAVYLHTDTIGVTPNQLVTRGQTIATMGDSGDTDFLHLHFEVRVETPCSLPYQAEHPDSGCTTGFDPHVHPFLFVGGENADRIAVDELPDAPRGGLAVRYTADRGDLDLDVMECDLGGLGFDERAGIDARTVATLDRFEYGWVRLVPQPFLSTTEQLVIDFYFPKRPAYLEFRDIYGRGLRFGDLP